MGRGRSKGAANQSGLLQSVTDNLDYNEWIRENLKNPEFMRFGREARDMDTVKQLWREKRAQAEAADFHETTIEEAIKTTRDAIPDQTHAGWFRNADSSIKPKLMDFILQEHGVLNAGMNIAYYNYVSDMKMQDKPALSFKKWLRTPQTLYRGDRGQKRVAGDVFASYTPDKRIAEKFGDNITQIRVRPIDTWGGYQTTGEQEFLVPIKVEAVKKKKKG